ncbi:class II D-tagatose-bisphosphate aldolase non-catalytic subunit [Anaerotruncus sp. DFI.9.16]|uniref:class II D-tagatose-bisphosphate aldolase non-catalytic subunit n=1 Tax=Anaerotruncus sp. DFI.9.16 TaxID=2965275 RepID=UPI00210E3CAC|nr:class II D-tagatose-bisphosphate aldolase, non-catalytic subunit [Anaerotruncus sp. DFI.9.16]MCQ4895861.1 class II D-tagatose-bisphosphate aldolase, non-catalytic subunit [Anaerotruncus sp. DFI.9.16]
MQKPGLREFMQGIYKLEEAQNLRCTMLGIGPMSENLIEACFLLAKKKDFPVMFIASRNQVDADEFGGGYVCSWNQDTFRRDIAKIAGRCRYDGLYYLCRDHGGPWQRDKERSDKLPVAEAMELGKRSYLYDLKAGFDLLHIDPTKIPDVGDVVPMDMVLDLTIELIEYCEAQRKALGLPPVAYEVGTEETNGGLTGVESYNQFINKLVERLNAKGLPLPVYIVGQTGTLTRLTENVGHFNADQAVALSKAARVHGVGLKEHNGDYLSDFILELHPALGITATNVAPEYGVVETQTLLRLARIERWLCDRKMLSGPSRFPEVFTRASIASQRWRKWMVGDARGYTVDQVLADEALSAEVVEICGHYTFNDPEVKAEIAKMYAGLEAAGLDPHRIVVNAVMKSIERYVDAFNLEGITSKVAAVL